jgi:hypothetical protein
MKRRTFLAQAGVGLATTAVAPSAIAQAAPQVKWRLASSFPKSLDTIYGAGAFFCERVGKLTDGKFEITPYAAGQIVPALQVLDAVQQGHRRVRAYRLVLLRQQKSRVRLRLRDSIRSHLAAAIGVGILRRRDGAAAGLLQGIRDHPLPRRQHGDANGRAGSRRRSRPSRTSRD